MIKTLKPIWIDHWYIIPLELNEKFSEFIQKRNISLQRKSEFHVTVIGTKTSKQIEETCSSEEKKELIQFIKNFDFNFTSTGNVYFLKKDYGDHTRYSRIIEVKMENQAEFEKGFSRIANFPYSFFPHITTHTTATKKEKAGIGVGIYSKFDLGEYIWK